MKIKVDPSFFAAWVIFLLLGRTETVFTVFLCGMLHEAGHICAYYLSGVKSADIRLTACGISADFRGRTGVSYGKEIVCLLAGCAVNLTAAPMFLLINKLLPYTDGAMELCACNLAFGILNILPAYPLDGGRALFSLLASRLPLRPAKRITTAISLVTLVPLTATAVYALLYTGFNASLLLICGYLFVYILSGK